MAEVDHGLHPLIRVTPTTRQCWKIPKLQSGRRRRRHRQLRTALQEACCMHFVARDDIPMVVLGVSGMNVPQTDAGTERVSYKPSARDAWRISRGMR